MPDVFGVYDDMKVWEYLDFFARCYGIPGARRRRMIGDLLELVDLGDKRDAYVQSLSRGMQQRLCLAHTLVHDPQVLLLDEPASGLDPRARVELRELLRELRSLGKTIVISSHILPELEELCTAVAIVDHGQVLAHGKVADIERRLRFGAVLRVRILGAATASRRRATHFAADPRVASATILDDGQIELGFRGDDEAAAQLLARGDRRPGSGSPRSPGRRATSRSCSSRSPHGRRAGRRWPEMPTSGSAVDGRPGGASRTTPRSSRSPGARPHRRGAGGASTARARGRTRSAAFRSGLGGITAVGVKELRGRVRGRRAFVVLTFYLLFLGLFAWAWELVAERAYVQNASLQGGSAAFASAHVGQEVFGALVLVETLLVVFLAPGLHVRRDQPRAREADARHAGGDADLVARDRRRQALQRPRLRLPADRRLDPADGDRVRLRRGRAGRRPAGLRGADRVRDRSRRARAVHLGR